MKKILLTGKDGQVGGDLQHTLAHLGKVITCDRKMLDLSDPQNIRRVIQDVKPDIIINAGAYTAVDKAETDIALAYSVNGTAPGILAEEAKKLGTLLIHYSTDYVFDGTSTIPYSESMSTAPLNTYGQTKLAGEQAIQAVGGKYLILRTSWVYATRGKNFLLTIMRLAKERDSLKIVGDQVGAPTWSRSIAETTAKLIDISTDQTPWGLYHLTCGGATTWFEFAKTFLEMHQSRFIDFRMPQLLKITTPEYPTPAKRPLYSVLSNAKLTATFGIELPHWKHALECCMRDYP